MIPHKHVAAVLLAAGSSDRFGAANKLLAQLGGRPLVQHLSERLRGLRLGALIAVCSDDQVASLLAEEGFSIVRNDAPGLGLSRSLALGMASVPADMQAALLCLADMPNVPTEHIEALMAAFDAEDAPVIASDCSGQAMPPALFGRSHFALLSAQSGDRGARDLLHGAFRVPASSTALADIDTPADLARRH